MENKKNSAPKPPEFYEDFLKKYPTTGARYEEPGQSIHDLGPLDERERALIKLAISGSNLHQSAFKAHIRKAIAIG